MSERRKPPSRSRGTCRPLANQNAVVAHRGLQLHPSTSCGHPDPKTVVSIEWTLARTGRSTAWQSWHVLGLTPETPGSIISYPGRHQRLPLAARKGSSVLSQSPRDKPPFTVWGIILSLLGPLSQILFFFLSDTGLVLRGLLFCGWWLFFCF